MKILLETADSFGTYDQVAELLEQMAAAEPDGTLSILGGGHRIACRLPTEQELAVTRVPAAIRHDQRFRTGYNLGYGHGSFQARLQAQARPASAPPEPPAGEASIQDITELTASYAVTVVPCCGRSITLPQPPDAAAIAVVCCACKNLYSVVLAQEEPNGWDDHRPWTAALTMTTSGLSISKHRAGRWEYREKAAAKTRARHTSELRAQSSGD